MSRRSRKAQTDLDFELPALPFMSIMLGLMSVMALASMGLAVQKRQELQKQSTVALVEIPPGLVPVHMRCRQNSLMWLDDTGTWNEIYMASATDGGVPFRARAAEVDKFFLFLRDALEKSRELSFKNQQHCVILWIEPDGIRTSYQVQGILSQLRIPLRIGQLPVLDEEAIRSEGQK